MATLDNQLSVDMGLVITREEAECQINRKVEIPKSMAKGEPKASYRSNYIFYEIP